MAQLPAWRKILFATFATLMASPIGAHEYWVEPQGAPILQVGDSLQAEFKVGQHFKGSRNAFIPNNIRRAELRAPDGTEVALNSLIGQRPAIQEPATQEGTSHEVLIDAVRAAPVVSITANSTRRS